MNYIHPVEILCNKNPERCLLTLYVPASLHREPEHGFSFSATYCNKYPITGTDAKQVSNQT